MSAARRTLTAVTVADLKEGAQILRGEGPDAHSEWLKRRFGIRPEPLGRERVARGGTRWTPKLQHPQVRAVNPGDGGARA